MTCGYRHWFAYRGYVGSSSPKCVRCGAPNPHYRRNDDPNATTSTTSPEGTTP